MLAHALSERDIVREFWEKPLTSSRLLQYEVWNRLHAYQASPQRHEQARRILRRVGYLEMTADTLMRALRPFESPIKTLDSLHLATMDHLRVQGVSTTLASYDMQLVTAARAMGFGAVQP